MNLFNRFQGIFLNPQQTFKALSEKPVWVDALILLLIVTAVFFYITGPYMQQDTIKAFENDIEKRNELGEEAFNQRLEFMKNPPKILAILQPFVFVPLGQVIALLILALIVFILGRMTSTEGKYVQVFSALTHANFINVLGMAVTLIMVLSQKTFLGATTSLAIFFPKLETTSLAFNVLKQFDFFQLWVYGVLGFGVAAIFKVNIKKALVISYCLWAIQSGFLILLAVVS